jgi:transposase
MRRDFQHFRSASARNGGLETDGRIAEAGDWRAFCHYLRPIPDRPHCLAGGAVLIAAEPLRRIAELYAIETTIRGQTAVIRRSVRPARSLPMVGAMKLWLEAQLAHIPPRSGLAEAVRYAQNRWDALCHFLDDGRIELDTNTVERAIRPVTLGRKNHLFAGSDRGADRWATVCSLITTAKLNDVEPFAYLQDVLERMLSGIP